MMDIHKTLILQQEVTDLVIPVDHVAHVQLGNSLDHALLVLIKSGYSAVPVLDRAYRIHGLVSKTLILDYILGNERMEYEKLREHQVEEVMQTKFPRMKANGTFFRALELSINQPFLCIENQEGVFTGILTRRSILALVYRYFKEHKQQ